MTRSLFFGDMTEYLREPLTEHLPACDALRSRVVLPVGGAEDVSPPPRLGRIT